MHKAMFKRGFTLIELLVVIAIIGILASVVLASLNSARSKGADAAIKSSINNVRAQAAIYLDDNSSSYTGLCATLTDAASAVNNAGGTWVCNDAGAAAGDEYAVSSVLVSPATTTYYCVDSNGASSESGTVLGSLTQCP